MRQKRFLIYLLCQCVVIIGVVIIFRIADDRKIAAAEAGALFLFLPLLLGWKEFRTAGLQRKSFYVGLLQFWLFFALPILGLRIFNWNVPFVELSLLGIPGPTLHQYANASYVLMMVLTAWNYFRKADNPLKA